MSNLDVHIFHEVKGNFGVSLLLQVADDRLAHKLLGLHDAEDVLCTEEKEVLKK